ncbi:MAG: pyridoxal phosphate-dependent aminotransferase family protein [Bacteroidia bacterium]|nr:pyridoxal phosphate-dependent aminotransferase family protein [Bacteroidia bacterium]
MADLQRRIESFLAQSPERTFWAYPTHTPDFTTNDYLGLIRTGVVQEVLRQAPLQWWRGSGASRYLGGDCTAYEEVEQAILSLHGSDGEAALFFSSGMSANLAFWSVVPRRGDTVVFDREVHASIRHGIRLSGAAAWGFPHNDYAEAEKRIRRAKGTVFLAIESLYSMRGTQPDVEALRYLQARYECQIVVDEAHTTLLLPEGRSWTQTIGMTPLAHLYTFGKAVGLAGAAWVAPEWLIAYLRRAGFSGIYSTAMPPIIAWAVAEILRSTKKWESHRRRLGELIAFTRYAFEKEGITYEGFQGPIGLVRGRDEIPFLKKLYPPTVAWPAHRISLHAHNTKEEIEDLIEKLRSQQT